MKLSNTLRDTMLFWTVALMYIAVCAEVDIYVPSFPQMVSYFAIQENEIHVILSLNFIGLCIAGMICGPMSDVYGCRKVLLGGLALFAISSIGCIFAESFPMMIFWRVIQGAGASVPMVVGGAVLLHTYPADKAGQMVGLINGIITAAMAGAPVLGTILNLYFDWRANFVAILILVLFSLLGTYLFITDAKQEKRKKVNIKMIVQDYLTIAASLKFFTYSMIVLLPFIGIVVYIANLSLIFINHLNVSPSLYALYQATTMGTFVIFSLLSARFIATRGLAFTKKLGLIVTTIGATFLLLTAIFAPSDINLICISMALFAAGGSMLPGTFGMGALEIFSHIKGTASAMMTTYRQLLATLMVVLSEIFFDGTIVPVAVIIFSCLAISLTLYFIVESKSPKTSLEPLPEISG